MIRTVFTVRMLQAVAAVVGIAVVLWSVGIPFGFSGARAAAVTNASDTLSDSAPGVAANHTIEFTTENGLSIGQTIEITFANDFGMGSVGEDDVDISVGGADQATAGSAGPGTWGVGVAGQTITLETPTDTNVASSTAIEIEVGTNATSSGTGANQITNPSGTGSYEIDIGGTMQDDGQVRVAIVESVTVTANVDTTLNFTVSGVSDGATVNGSPTTTATSTTATTLPFETLEAGTSKTLAHDLSVTTNASNGFTVTVEQSGNLQSSTGADIDGFIDGAYTDTPSAWQGPSATIGDEDTYGHWGVTSDDSDFSGTADRWVAASTTPRAVLTHNTVADGTTTGEGSTRVGYQAEISSLQEAGTDYTTTITYIATPTF